MAFFRTHKTVIITAILALVIGISLGFFMKNIPFFELERKVKIMDIFSLIATLVIAILAPFFIKKWIDDNQTIKKYLVEEIRLLIEYISVNTKIIHAAKLKGTFEQKDRDNINYAFHTSETQIESIENQLGTSFPDTSKKIIAEIKTAHRAYKDFLTGGELMISDFTEVTTQFDRTHTAKYNKVTSELKELIHKIHRL